GAAESAGMLEGAASSIGSNIDALSNAIETVVGAVQRMESEIGGLSTSIVTTNRSVERVNYSLTALSQGVQSVNSITEESSELSKKTTRDAESGRDASEETIRAMNDIASSFNRLSDSVSSLAMRSEAIDRVIEVIDDVTRATNLLGFNASIIAAQAGEHGAGFAVVAERVKSLADSTRQSTREIGELVVDVRLEIDRAAAELNDSARLIRDGETLSLKAAESLGVIIESSEDAAAMVSRIQEATGGQDKRLQDLQESVLELRAVNERLEKSATEQRNSLQYIANSVLNARDINERVSATARAQAAETMSIAGSAQVVDSQTRGIRDEVAGQRQATESLQHAFTGFARSAENSAERSAGLDQTVRELGAHLKRLEETLSHFKL
ncbi:MAG: methyl-accepting chemotaxis protein, partial [Myxococcota bacterium]